MRYSKLFGKSRKDAPKDEVSVNAKLLLKAGFIDKLMAGSYTLLPLGFRVVKKIEQVIREEINKTGAEELLMPLLHPKSIWNETGRWESAKEVMYQFKKDDKEYALSFTHEEIVLDLIRKHTQSYKDFPVKIYHFSTKFRNEPRAKSGILRAREFLMKDLYSLHETKENLEKYYEGVKEAYIKIFKRLGLQVVVTEAGGGVFTKNITHEFQVLSESGEDEIIYCPSFAKASKGKPGYHTSKNIEISEKKEGDRCSLCNETLKKAKAIEVGNIFNFGQEYSKKMNIVFTDKNGKKQYPFLGSYGIGPTRVLGTIVEKYHDERGIIWPKSVAPFDVHLVHVEDPGTEPNAKRTYETLTKAGIDVLWDDREDVSAGEKFADADLIGIPVRLVVSAKTRSASFDSAQDKSSGQAVKVEWKERSRPKDDRPLAEKVELMSLEEAVKRLQP